MPSATGVAIARVSYCSQRNVPRIAGTGKRHVMQSLHLACDVFTEPVDCPYLPFRAASVRAQAAAVGFSYGYTGSAASTILYIICYRNF